MAWDNPKKDWKAGDTPNSGDFNRIEGNIDILGRLDRTSAYGVTIGTNAYAVTLDPAPNSYYEGMCIAIKIGNQNTGVSTINVNGLGAKSIRKANGNTVSAGNLKKDSIYTMRYNGVNFILQGEGGEGTAKREEVLMGKTFTNNEDTFEGTMPNNGAINATITKQNEQISIPSGYTSGGVIKAMFDNLVATNIKAGVNIGGIIGTLIDGTGMVKFASGTFPLDANTGTVSNLTFLPKLIIVFNAYSWSQYPYLALYSTDNVDSSGNPGGYGTINIAIYGYDRVQSEYRQSSGVFTNVTSIGFTWTGGYGGSRWVYKWIAIG